MKTILQKNELSAKMINFHLNIANISNILLIELLINKVCYLNFHIFGVFCPKRCEKNKHLFFAKKRAIPLYIAYIFYIDS